MTFDEWFKITIKSDFKIATNEIYPRDIVGMEHLKKWIKLIYNTGWNDGRGSKTTEQILSSLEAWYSCPFCNSENLTKESYNETFYGRTGCLD